MNDINKAMDILQDTIIESKTHQDYPRVNALRKEYLQIFTGEDLRDLLKPYHKRTEDEVFDQVVATYNSTMPEMANRLDKTFSKPFRSNRIIASVESKSNLKASNEIIDYQSNFWYGESENGLDPYLRTRWFHLQKFDPNAFIATHFEDVPNVTKKTSRIYPKEYSSEQVRRFLYQHGVLDWLLIREAIKFQIKMPDGTIHWVDGSRYVFYMENDTIVLTEVDPATQYTTLNDTDWESELRTAAAEEVPNPVFFLISRNIGQFSVKAMQSYYTSTGGFNGDLSQEGSGMVFQIQVLKHGAGKVPAKRVGYVLDPRTEQRTCVSIYHPARSCFHKELKAGSELDLAIAAHCHPQKVMITDPCEECQGKTTDIEGNACTKCHGSGFKDVSTSSIDVVRIKRPNYDQPWPDLSNMVAYLKPDIDVIKFLDEYVYSIAEKAMRAVFGGQAVERKTVDKTATEMDYSMDDVYDTLSPFGKSYSAMWKFQTEMISIYSSNQPEDLIIYHAFPNDFKLKTLVQLMEERKLAEDAGLPQQIMEAIDRDIQDVLYADDQDTLKKLEVRAKFNPFPGKSQTEITAILSQNRTTKFNAVLYTHLNLIFQEIENEATDPDAFYLMEYKAQKAAVTAKVQEISAALDTETTARVILEQGPEKLV